MGDVGSDTDFVGIALLITALGTLVTAIAGAIVITRRVTDANRSRGQRVGWPWRGKRDG